MAKSAVKPSTWEQRKLGEEFTFLKNNTLSRAELSESEGAVRNIHYGDVLIKFGSTLDVANSEIPRIASESMARDLACDRLCEGDVVVADTAEDEAAGKCTELRGLGSNEVVGGLHTMPLRPIENYVIITRREHRPFHGLRIGAHAVCVSRVSRSRNATSSRRAACAR